MHPTHFTLVRSNSQHQLFDTLRNRIKQDYAGKLFEPVTLIVRNSGMRNYLIRSITEKDGIFANIRFYYPEHLSQLFPQDEMEILSDDINYLFTFEVFKHLSDPAFYRAFTGIRAEKQPDLKLFNMAENISHLLLNSMYYNPEPFLREYLPNRNAQMLWERVTRSKRFHLAHEQYLALKDKSIDSLPENIYVFGIPFLTGFEFLMLSLISQHSQIHYFQQTPTDTYWFDVAHLSGENRKQKIDDKEVDKPDKQPIAANKIINHDFLFYFGKAQRLFERRLLTSGAYDHYRDCFEAETGNSVLSLLRQAMMKNENLTFPDRFDAKDRSFRVHACPDVFREISVVYNEILDVLKTGEALPSQILVTAPDISVYKAAIDDVFGSNLDNIPYFTADQTEFIQSELYLFLEFIFKHSYLDISTEHIKTLLGFQTVCEKFGISQEEQTKINRWLKHIPLFKSLGESDVSQNPETDKAISNLQSFWKRCFYGYVLEQQNTALYQGQLPYPYLQGMDYVALGKLKKATDLLESVRLTFTRDEFSLENSRNLNEWVDYTEKIITSFTENLPANIQAQLGDIMNRVRKMTGKSAEISFDKDVFWRIFSGIGREYKTFSGGTSGNGICFSSILNVRGIPFEAIYILGLNHENFPGGNPGRNDYFFDNQFYPEPDIQEHRLHALISFFLNAQHRLHLSYIGYDYTRNFEIPPPISIELILTHLKTHQKIADNQTETDSDDHAFLIKHPLNPYHSSYFEGNPDKFSYSKNAYRLAEKVYGITEKPLQENETGKIWPGFDVPKILSEKTKDQLYMDDVIQFFSHPVRSFCRDVLNIRNISPPQTGRISEYEPITANYQTERVLTNLVDIFSESENQIKSVERTLNAIGNFPQKQIGEYYLKEFIEHSKQITALIPDYSAIEKEDLTVNVPVNNTVISGNIRLHGGVLLDVIPQKIRFWQIIRLYIRHLLLNAAGHTGSSYLLGEIDHNNVSHPVLLEFFPIPTVTNTLSELVKLYDAGQLNPLCILPSTTGKIIGELAMMYIRDKTPPENILYEIELEEKIDKILIKKPEIEFEISEYDYDFNDFYIKLCYIKPNQLPFSYKEDVLSFCKPMFSMMKAHQRDSIPSMIRSIFRLP